MRQTKRAIGILFLLCLVSCTTGPQRIFQAFVNSPSLESAHTGFVVKSLDDNGQGYRANATRFFLPASNMKLFTTAATLVLLGPEFRFTTGVYTDGALNKGVLAGNLFIKGVGDPTLSWRFHDGGAGRIFAEMRYIATLPRSAPSRLTITASLSGFCQGPT